MIFSELYDDRLSLLETTMSNKKGSRVPVISLCTTWAYYHAGKLPKHGLEDPEVTKKVLRKLYTDFYWDGIVFVRNGKTFSERTLNLLGGGTYQYDKNGMQQTKPGSVTSMEADEYPELISDPYKFILEKVFPRRYTLMQRNDEQKYNDMKEVMADVIGMFKRNAEEDKIAIEEFGIPQMRAAAFFNPVDIILDYFRDFNEILGDVKRRPQMVRDAGMSLVNFSLDHIGPIQPQPGKSLVIPMHLPQFLNAKDFEKVYLPSFKKVADGIAERGFKALYYFERSYAHLFDYLKELPQGTIGLFEIDDVREVKKKIGKSMCVAGGMPLKLLGKGTKQQCIDHAKAVIDEAAKDGGFLFTTDMMMLSPGDAKAENLQAVNEFVHKYGVY